MKTKKITMIVLIILAMILSAGLGAYAASNYGSSSDPLVTKSYLDDVLTPSIMEKFASKLAAAKAELAGSVSGKGGQTSGDGYTLVTLSKGQKIVGKVGCELLLRIGTATCEAQYSPGLVDVSTGGTLENGKTLTANHLYMVTIEDHGVKATASTVKILVRGDYTIS